MLLAEKYMDLDKSVLMVCGLILKHILQKKVEKVDVLLSIIEKNIGEGSQETFLAALSILYVLGKIDYLDKSDTLVMVT